jgi:DNA-binding response OmpR family regulator
MLAARILVVEDEPSVRLFLEEVLTGDGYEVVAADSGETALKFISEQVFDLALLDLFLGGINGMEVLGTLRQQSPDTVVILLTAHASLETAVEALRQGAHDYLFKPCKTVQLRESVRQGLLKRQRALNQRQMLHQLEQRLAGELEKIRATLASDLVESPAQISMAFTSPTPPEPAAEQGRFVQRGGLIVDLAQHVITLDGHLLELSLTEFDVLAYLASEAPRVIPPQELVREVQGHTSELWEARDIVRQYIHSLRQKIMKASGRTDIIRTVRGVGYALHE